LSVSLSVCVCKCVRINPLSLSYNFDMLPLYLKDNLPHECQFLPVQLDNGLILSNGNEYRMFRRKSSGQMSWPRSSFLYCHLKLKKMHVLYVSFKYISNKPASFSRYNKKPVLHYTALLS
jgi:hypothetical protein